MDNWYTEDQEQFNQLALKLQTVSFTDLLPIQLLALRFVSFVFTEEGYEEKLAVFCETPAGGDMMKQFCQLFVDWGWIKEPTIPNLKTFFLHAYIPRLSVGRKVHFRKIDEQQNMVELVDATIVSVDNGVLGAFQICFADGSLKDTTAHRVQFTEIPS